MADVYPFRALRYDPSLDLASIVCPPFDTISQELQRELYARSEYNAVRIELAESSGAGRYKSATNTLSRWMNNRILRRDKIPAFYLYRQSFPYGGKTYERRLLFARLRLVPWSDGVVLPHEQTFGGPKEDRIQLMRAARINSSPVFLFYRDDDDQIHGLVSAGEQQQAPVADFKTADGQRHQLLRLDEPETIERLTHAFEDEKLYIADGHHRYETALAYRDETQAAASEWRGDEPENFVMVALIDYNDPGMLVLPFHRMTKVETPLAEAHGRIEGLFDLSQVPGDAPDLTAALDAAGDGLAIGLVTAEGMYLLTPRDAAAIDALMPQERAPEWRALDYAIVNQVLLQHCLGLTEERMKDYDAVKFTEDAEKAVAAVRTGAANYALVMRPLPVERVLALADLGERMPQKSTFFYPKVPTGVVFNLLED
ncbi:MAG TPA: DUF1015 domain-containing protein [Dehalococcoidia bacterium]|nr:DUF1015 domain-containing protein [Dehalococcoidia bacterium]